MWADYTRCRPCQLHTVERIVPSVSLTPGGRLGYSRRMTTPKYSTDAAREVVKQALRRDPSVHLFDDEADRMSRAVIRALVAHWPARFSDKDRAKGEGAK